MSNLLDEANQTIGLTRRNPLDVDTAEGRRLATIRAGRSGPEQKSLERGFMQDLAYPIAINNARAERERREALVAVPRRPVRWPL
jgi:hypothetical protein